MTDNNTPHDPMTGLMEGIGKLDAARLGTFMVEVAKIANFHDDEHILALGVAYVGLMAQMRGESAPPGGGAIVATDSDTVVGLVRLASSWIDRAIQKRVNHGDTGDPAVTLDALRDLRANVESLTVLFPPERT